MPLRPHKGLPGSSVIPEGWSAVHAPVVTRTFDCTVRIGPAGGTPVFRADLDPPRTVTTPADPVYAGPASIGLVSTSDGTREEVVGQQVNQQTYEIKLPATTTAAVTPEHQVTVDASPDPALTGRTLHVTSIATPGRAFSRIVFATLIT